MRTKLLARLRYVRSRLIISLMMVFLACVPREESNDDTVTVSLTEIDDVLPNPYKGFVPWVGSSNPVYDTKLYYGAYTWKNLEPVKGEYDWDYMESGWPDPVQTGRRVGFRISAAYPHSGEVDIPQWLVDEGVALRPYDIEGMQGLAPDWDDPRFLSTHRDLILALGSRYDNDPRVGWIDIGSYGFWGEWHVWQNEELAATQATKQSILEDYFDTFPTKPKVIAFDDDFATRFVTDRSGGIRNDCLGTAGSNDWYLTSVGELNSTVWKSAMITGEFCGGTSGAIAGTTERFTLNYEFIRETHWSFLGPAGGGMEPQSEEHRENMDKIHKRLGYRFVLRQAIFPKEVTVGDTFNFQLELRNRGVAPFYFAWPLVLCFVDFEDIAQEEQVLDIDIRSWLPGDVEESIEVAVPAQLPTGTYKLRLAIHDPLTNRPGIWFANEGRDEDGRYSLGNLRVVD
ncbi:MAG: DUF4832 domain-containing protein [Fidelibacterota bacterium]|nr:MAG: DUF4832 domain-containing protein [Candidatus Neomarinimicrobiota bacterium]